jgi:hypothetical protein
LSFACFDTAGLKQGKKMLSPVLRMCEKGLNKLKIDNNLKLLQASLPNSLSLDCKQALRETAWQSLAQDGVPLMRQFDASDTSHS